MKMAFYGSSLLSSYWNGAATYYRGMLSELARHGWDVTFYEPDAFDRQKHRDIEPPDWARVVVYDATPEACRAVIARAADADVVVKANGVGVFDDELLDGVMDAAGADALRVYWDVDAPATLAAMRQASDHPLRRRLPQFDFVLTYGGGPPVVAAYETMGARVCRPVYNALDPATHHPVPPQPRFAADLNFLGNRLPDREARVERFFLDPAARNPEGRYIIGGSGWETNGLPANVTHIGHVGTADHNAFNTSALAVLNIARDSMAEVGFSPATRVFEAAGAGACLITDPAARALHCSVEAEAYTPRPVGKRWDLSYLGTYSPDRQPTLERLLLEPARRAPRLRFAVAGPQYPDGIAWPDNVERLDHVPPADHPAFYAASRFTLNVTRADMIRAGHSPSVRLFEAAACATPIISDLWDGLDALLEPDREIILARSAADVLGVLGGMDETARRTMGERARRRILDGHTATHRAEALELDLIAAARPPGHRPDERMPLA